MSVLDAIERLAMSPAMRAPLEGAPVSAEIPRLGRVVETLPDPRLRAVAHLYAEEAGLPYRPSARFVNVNPEQARDYALAYDRMANDLGDPLVQSAWRRMGAETLDQLDALHAGGYRFRFNPAGVDPYAASPRLALEDLKHNHRLSVFPTEAGYGTIGEASAHHPLLEPVRGRGHLFEGAPFVMNDAFRVVHDALGHAPIGAGFRAGGEENAFRHHLALYSDMARPAMTAETRGQNSWVNFGPFAHANQGASGADTVYADQKAGLMPDFVYNRGVDDFMGPISIDELRKRIAAAMLMSLGGGGGVLGALQQRRAA